MANIGEQLLTPENEMQRIDDRNNKIIYNGTFIQKDDANKYNSTSTYTTTLGNSIEFYFYGTKFYIVDMFYNTRSNNIIVEVDGIVNGAWNGYNDSATIQKVLVYKVEDLKKQIHKVKITNSSTISKTTMLLDAIDIDEDGYMCTQEDYELQEAKNKLFPVRVADDTVKSEENVANYTATLVNGERQLLLLNNGDMYLSDGKGSHIKMSGSSKELHANQDVLDLLTTDGQDLYFNGKNVQKIELTDGQDGYSATIMNAIANGIYTINIEKGSALCDQIIQVWEFEEGGTDITTVAKTFNNHTTENFFYDDNIVFTDEVCKVKDEFILENTLNDEGLYETKFNKNEFIDLINLTSEVNE